MRESVDRKARRYLAEGRLRVLSEDVGAVTATCRGGGATTYRLGRDRGGWWCTCPARGRCSHLTALALVAGAVHEGVTDG